MEDWFFQFSHWTHTERQEQCSIPRSNWALPATLGLKNHHWEKCGVSSFNPHCFLPWFSSVLGEHLGGGGCRPMGSGFGYLLISHQPWDGRYVQGGCVQQIRNICNLAEIAFSFFGCPNSIRNILCKILEYERTVRMCQGRTITLEVMMILHRVTHSFEGTRVLQ